MVEPTASRRDARGLVRRAESQFTAFWNSTPQWVAIRRANFATKVHDLLYGHKARPLGRLRRLSWTRLLAFYTRSRMLTYGEALGVAEELACELRAQRAVLQPTPETDDQLRRLLSSALTAAAKRNAAARPPVDRWTRDEQLIDARVAQRTVGLLLASVCPLCGRESLPCEACRVPAVVLDRRGGLVAARRA